MATQEEWRRIAYKRSLGQQGTPVGTITSYTAYQRDHLPRVGAERQRNLDNFCQSGWQAAPVADFNFSQSGRPAASAADFGGSISGGSFPGASYVPAPAGPAPLLFRLTLAAIVLGGVGTGL
jgi:hypothetical protein